LSGFFISHIGKIPVFTVVFLDALLNLTQTIALAVLVFIDVLVNVAMYF
jgi:hypothetical protein